MWVAHLITKLFPLIHKPATVSTKALVLYCMSGTSQRNRVWQRRTVNIQGQTKQTYVQELKLILKDITYSCQTAAVFFISCLLLTPPYLLSALCWVYCTSQPSSSVPFFRKHNISFFWWRLHKSESFISRQHTSSKTPERILLFLSNHFLSIFWCQDPSWLTSAGSIWVPYRPVFPVFCHDTWLISVLFSVYVEGGRISAVTRGV